MLPRGTKGDNGAVKDLGGAKKLKDASGKEVMEVELPTEREDINQVWNASRQALSQKPPEEKEHRDAATKQADRDRNSRTNVVLAWVGTNMCVPQHLVSVCALVLISASFRLMILVFTSTAFTNFVSEHVEITDNANFNPYLTFLFFAM